MAELNSSPGKPTGKYRTKRVPLRVDLTAMVDLAFLLITFFMLTTSLTKPKAMPITMPSDGPQGAVSDKRTMTICLGQHNKAMWYLGLADKPIIAPTLTGYGEQIRTAILETSKKVYASTGKNLIVLIKPAPHSVYANLVDVLDELNIAGTPTYAIVNISAKDVDLLKQKGIY